MNDNINLQASNLLWTSWQDRAVIDELPQTLRPATRPQGYAVQALLEQHSSKPLFGWKIAATSTAGQQHIGVDGPLAGRILAERVREDGATIGLAGNRMRVAECEFAFRMGRDLVPRSVAYTIAETMVAVASLHPAIEIPDSRYRQFEKVGAAQLIADNACADLMILGAKTTCNWRSLDLAKHAVTATIERAAATITHYHGIGSNVLGDPRIALTWLVNELSGIGITLKAGQAVITGTCLTPIAIAQGDTLRASFGPIGDISAQFAA